MKTASGKPISVTVAFRLPLDAYEAAVAAAEREQVYLSRVLRRATLCGLRAATSTADDAEKLAAGARRDGGEADSDDCTREVPYD